MDILIALMAAGAGYGGTYMVDRRQKPAVIVGGVVGGVAAIVSLFF